MRALLQDLRYGMRMVRRQPAFSAIVVATLALAIGANTVIFSFTNILLVRPLPLKETSRLGWLFAIEPHRGGTRGSFSIPELVDYRKAAGSFESIGATSRASVILTGRGDARRLAASRVSANLIDVWGLRLQSGRTFSASADAPGAAGEAILSHHYWQHELNADPATVGQTLTLNGRPFTVVGVLAPDIEIGNLSEIDVWIPLTLSENAARDERTLRLIGRLRPGVSVPQASAEVRQIAERLARDYPKTNEGWTARVAPTREAMTGTDTWVVLSLLSVVVGFVLLLACANVANLVLSRMAGRRRELAVRSALGASRARVIRQMLTENTVYGVCGGIVGLGLAFAGLETIRAVAYEPFFRLVQIDRNVLAFTALLALATPLLFAILPALQSTRTDVNDALKDGVRMAGGNRAARSRSVLIVTQLALAVMLLVLATLLIQALRNLTNAPLGIDATRIVTARLELPVWRYGDDHARADYFERMIERVKALPAVKDAGITSRLPIIDGEPATDLIIEGRAVARAQDRPWAVTATVSNGYFASAGIPTIAGHVFTLEDRPGRIATAVVNKELARRHWSSPANAIGTRVVVADARGAASPVQIIGVVGDVLRSDREAVNPQLYFSSQQRPEQSAALVVRTADPAAAAPDVRAAIRSIDPDVPVYELRPMQEALDDDNSSSRVLGGLFGAFALVALVLAASGLYAVVSYATAQRVKEIGVRVALGALPGDISRMMLRQTAFLVAIGVVLGLAGGRALAAGASTLLFRVSPSDPATYAGVAATLAAVALLASYVPVRRATSIDPVTALRLD